MHVSTKRRDDRAGRRCTIGNRVCAKSVPRVRIPISPPLKFQRPNSRSRAHRRSTARAGRRGPSRSHPTRRGGGVVEKCGGLENPRYPFSGKQKFESKTLFHSISLAFMSLLHICVFCPVKPDFLKHPSLNATAIVLKSSADRTLLFAGFDLPCSERKPACQTTYEPID